MNSEISQIRIFAWYRLLSIQMKFTHVLFKKWPRRLLLLPKWKSDSGFGFSQIFDSGSERKTQNPGGVDSATPDPWPTLPHTCACNMNNVVAYISGRNPTLSFGNSARLSIMAQANPICSVPSLVLYVTTTWQKLKAFLLTFSAFLIVGFNKFRSINPGYAPFQPHIFCARLLVFDENTVFPLF